MLTFPIGGLDLTNLALRENVALPVLTEDVPVLEWFDDCLKQALAERRGVALLAAHGAGKSLAVTRNLYRFHEAETLRRTTKDGSYQSRLVVPLTTLRVDTSRALFGALYTAAFKTPPVDRVYRRTKTEEEIRDDLIVGCAEANIAAFVIDEAQTLSNEALEALRDLMAAAEFANADRWAATAAGEESTPAGLGILLVGTPELERRLKNPDALERRWVRVEKVGLMPAARVPYALAKLLPPFAEGARVMGEEGWAHLVEVVVSQGRDLPVSTLHDLARAYVRRAAELTKTAQSVADLPWHDALFRQAAYELLGLVIRSQEAA